MTVVAVAHALQFKKQYNSTSFIPKFYGFLRAVGFLTRLHICNPCLPSSASASKSIINIFELLSKSCVTVVVIFIC